MTMKTPKTVVSALIDAREIVKTRFGKGWGSPGQNRCALGACREVLAGGGGYAAEGAVIGTPLYKKVTAALNKALGTSYAGSYESSIISFNDASATTQQQVADLFTKAISLELAARK